MRCQKCGNETDEGWSFCPRCGSKLEKQKERDLFSDIFERMERELNGMNRSFERNFEVIDLSPFFTRPTKGSGFSIKITQGSGDKPKVSIKTFGDVKEKEVENEVSKLGFGGRIKKALKPEIPEKKETKDVCIGEAKRTEEPETCVRKTDGKIVAEVKLPGVKNTGDIEVKALENSIEVKAMAGDKAYFKILTKPPQTSVVKKEFRKGVLTIELV